MFAADLTIIPLLSFTGIAAIVIWAIGRKSFRTWNLMLMVITLSIGYGIFLQQNLGLILLSLAFAQLLILAFSRMRRVFVNEKIWLILGFFNFFGLLLILLGSSFGLLQFIWFVLLNSTLATIFLYAFTKWLNRGIYIRS